ncbi:MAG: hypothetical protein C5B59_06745 [Bacteroidetes bacterium]|nr:MAG: hypothetical protein C5B59_06745 [Bacteroidota bacterium]
MAKATLNIKPMPKPPVTFTIQMSEEEAKALAAVLLDLNGPLERATYSIWNSLDTLLEDSNYASTSYEPKVDWL